MCKDDSASSLMVGNGIEKQKQQQLYFVSSKCIVAAVHSFNLLIHWSGVTQYFKRPTAVHQCRCVHFGQEADGWEILTGYVWVGNTHWVSMGGKYGWEILTGYICMTNNGWPRKLDPPGGERVWVSGGGEDVESSWVGLLKIIQGLYKLPGAEWSVKEHWHLNKILWISR